jgi:tetratricopeptide (TPR) repeat protein
MSRWIPGLLLAGLLPLAAQEQTTPQTAPPKPQLEERTEPKTSGKQAVPAEEDKSFLTEEHSFNPLQSQKNVETGDFYLKKGKFQAAANRYLNATMWNEGNAEAWAKLGKAEEKVKDVQAAKDAYNKYLELAPDAKDAAAVRKRLQAMK